VSLRIEMLKDVRYVPANLLSDLCKTTLPVTNEGNTLRAWSSDYYHLYILVYKTVMLWVKMFNEQLIRCKSLCNYQIPAELIQQVLEK